MQIFLVGILSSLSLLAEVPSEIPYRVERTEVAPNSSVYQTLSDLGLPTALIHEVLTSARAIRPLRTIAPKTPIFAYFLPGPLDFLDRLRLDFSVTESLEVSRSGAGWHAHLNERPVTHGAAQFSGLVSSSLWESAVDAGMDPEIIVSLTEVFAWQVDFNREVRKGDEWRLVVQSRWVDGKQIGWGSILAAEYKNSDTTYTGVRFQNGYYATDGQSLRKLFLKSPIRFGRISSRFSRNRFHPVLKIHRPHLGVDYAAPTGTPIRSVGDGAVEFAGWRGGGGNTIRIRHNSVYSTAYLHLSRLAPGVRRGKRIRQGDVIGYVGSTGLATGPHLHFEFYENGRFVDPLGRKFPSAEPVSSSQLSQFTDEVNRLIPMLPSWYSEAQAAERKLALQEESTNESLSNPKIQENPSLASPL